MSGVASALDEEMEMMAEKEMPLPNINMIPKAPGEFEKKPEKMAEDDDETPLGADAGNFEAEAIPAVGMG